MPPITGTGDKAASVNLDAESPHTLAGASTRDGKSVSLRCITYQMLHHGSPTFILDTKWVSHPWARDPPSAVQRAMLARISRILSGSSAASGFCGHPHRPAVRAGQFHQVVVHAPGVRDRQG
ncbi:hypothetical protein [Streptomyces radiopugnans]|uniref:hypothetical protein n=1 Tax=Streptomyces radiopugnans TaxID=403935 RepID=UPI003F1CCF52